MNELRVGQIWADNDPRSAGRTVRIAGFECHPKDCEITLVVCTVLTDGVENAAYREKEGLRSPVGRSTKIRADRFRPTKTGYRLVSEPTVDRFARAKERDGG